MSLIGTKAGGKHAALTEYVPDGLHLSTKGYRLLYDEIRTSIAKDWGERDDLYPRKFPYWKDWLSKPEDANIAGAFFTLFPQFVLFGDSQIEFSTEIKDGFSLNAQLHSGKETVSTPQMPPCEESKLLRALYD
jgi:hypothetical protein